MTWGFGAQRRADDFRRRWSSEPRPTAPEHPTDPRDAELLELVGALRCGPRPAAAPRVRRRPAQPADGRGRDRAGPDRRRRGSSCRPAVPSANAASPPSSAASPSSAPPPPSRWRPSRRCPASRSTRSSGSSSRRTPGCPLGEARKGSTELANAVQPPRRGHRADPGRRLGRRRADRPDAQHLHRAGHLRRRPAARRLRRHRPRGLDRPAARLRVEQHGPARRRSSRRSRTSPATS